MSDIPLENKAKKQDDQRPTREQTLAKSIDRHISVTANAGSGKTSVLVDRYYKIITEGDKANNIPPVEPRDIKAITFTNKAAAEMKERLVRKISDEAQATADPARIEFLNELRVKLSNADISTIHSFCGSILRAFPIEAGVSPNFRECTEGDTFVIRKQVIGSVIDDILYEIGQNEDSDPIDVEEFKELIYAVGGLGRLSDYIDKLIINRMTFDKVKGKYSASFEEHSEVYYKKIDKLLRDLLFEIKDSLMMILDNANFNTPSRLKWKEGIISAISFVEVITQGVEEMGRDVVLEDPSIVLTGVWGSLSECGIFKENGELSGNKLLKGALDKSNKELINSINKPIAALFFLKKTVAERRADLYQFKYSKLLVKITEKAIAKYDAELLQNDMLDFDNLILKANKLLTEYPDRELVANTLRDKIKYLMVDEFQDTDSVQYGLIKEIIRNIGSSYASSSNINNNLFIVGDPKQSIYGFRGADVSVFNQAKEDIIISNIFASDTFKLDGEEIQAVENEGKGEIILKSTFRNTPDIAFFVNDVCNPMFEVTPSPFMANENEKDEEQREFDKQFTKYGVKYEDLVTALISAKLDKTQLKEMAENLESDDYSTEQITDIINNLEDTGKGDNIFGSITLLNYVKNKSFENEESDRDNNDLHHYDYLIDHILKVKEETGADFKDFAVVSRTKPLLEELSLKLIERGVPFLNHASSGFYGVPEVQSIISLLKFISNSNDDVAFMSVLRSSFCGFDNTDLYFLSMVYKRRDDSNIKYSSLSMFEKMEHIIKSNYIPENEEVRYRLDKYKATHKILRELIDTKLDLEPAIMLRKAFELFNWYNVISDSPYRERIKTNADKIVQMAREYVRQGFKNIYDFVNELEYLSENQIKEAEAVLQSSADQINLLTVHASKGTEYKYLVYISGNHQANTRNTDGILIDDYFGITFKYRMYADSELSEDEKQINIGTATFKIDFTNSEIEYPEEEEYHKCSFHKLSEFKNKNKILEEEKRIYYVGMTRAKKGLIIFSKLEDSSNKDNETNDEYPRVIKAKANTLFTYICNAINIKEDDDSKGLYWYLCKGLNARLFGAENTLETRTENYEIREIVNEQGKVISADEKRRLLLIAGREHINCTLNYHTPQIRIGLYVTGVDKSPRELKQVDTGAASQGAKQEEMTDILTSNISGKYISATEMKLYANDKDKYQVKYLLGLHSDDKKNHFTKPGEQDEEIEAFTAMDFGTATHRVFEYIKKWYKSGQINDLALDETINMVMSTYFLLKDDELAEKRAEIKSLVRDVVATGYLANYEAFIEDSAAEFTILHSLADNVLQGQLDMLIKNNKGEYEVWDWKTDKLNGRIDQLAENYAAQMKQYAFLLSQFCPGQSEYNARLLFVRGAKNAKSDADWVRTHTIKQEDLAAFEQETIENIKGINNHPFFNNANG